MCPFSNPFIDKICEQVVSVAGYMAQLQGISCKLRYRRKDGKIYAQGDPRRFSQVLSNVMDNAVKVSCRAQIMLIYYDTDGLLLFLSSSPHSLTVY